MDVLVRRLRLVAGQGAHAIGIAAMKVGSAIFFLWIGWLKFQPYEAGSIMPFVANSLFMRFFYAHPSDDATRLTKNACSCRRGVRGRS